MTKGLDILETIDGIEIIVYLRVIEQSLHVNYRLGKLDGVSIEILREKSLTHKVEEMKG